MPPLQVGTRGGIYVALGLLVALAVLAIRQSAGDRSLERGSIAPLLPLLVAFGAIVVVHAVAGRPL